MCYSPNPTNLQSRLQSLSRVTMALVIGYEPLGWLTQNNQLQQQPTTNWFRKGPSTQLAGFRVPNTMYPA